MECVQWHESSESYRNSTGYYYRNSAEFCYRNFAGNNPKNPCLQKLKLKLELKLVPPLACTEAPSPVPIGVPSWGRPQPDLPRQLGAAALAANGHGTASLPRRALQLEDACGRLPLCPGAGLPRAIIQNAVRLAKTAHKRTFFLQIL